MPYRTPRVKWKRYKCWSCKKRMAVYPTYFRNGGKFVMHNINRARDTVWDHDIKLCPGTYKVPRTVRIKSMSDKIIETVTIDRPLDRRLADLIHFARYITYINTSREQLADDKYMAAEAHAWWDMQHGE